MKKILVCGSSGFIGVNLVSRLKLENCYVVGVDIRPLEYETLYKPDEFIRCDLRDKKNCTFIMKDVEEIYQLAADTGSKKYITSHKISYMRNNSLINLNILDSASKSGIKKIVYISDLREDSFSKYIESLYNVYGTERCIDIKIIDSAIVYGKYSAFYGERCNPISEFIYNYYNKNINELNAKHEYPYIYVEYLINYILKGILPVYDSFTSESLAELLKKKTNKNINELSDWIKDVGYKTQRI